jgi:hypothetical protein
MPKKRSSRNRFNSLASSSGAPPIFSRDWWKDEQVQRLLAAAESRDWQERERLLASIEPSARREILQIFGRLPARESARKRILSSLAPDRRFLVELEDLIARFMRTAGTLFDQSDGKVEMSLDVMIEALEREADYLRHRIYQATGRWPESYRDDEEAGSADTAPGHKMSPLTAEQHLEWRNATPLEQVQLFLEHFYFGTYFSSRGVSTRGRPPDPETEWRSKLIAAYSQFREWERILPKAAIADTMARFKTSRGTVLAARRMWCQQMQHLHFDPKTAREYREQLDRLEDCE